MTEPVPTASPLSGLLRKAALALGGLAFGALTTVFVQPVLASKIVPAVLEMLDRGDVMALYPSDPSEKEQRFTVYSLSFFGDLHGVFVSAEAAPDGSFQTFHLNGQVRNGLKYFTFIPSDKNENGGGAFLGSKDEGKPNSRDYVGLMYGVDKWKRDKSCTLHRFAAVIGPKSDVENFKKLARDRLKEFAEFEDPSAEKTQIVLAPCRQNDLTG
jgi:hypothetical protein